MNNIYFNPTATSILKLAEQNICFYRQLIGEMGTGKFFAILWVGEDLAAFIAKVRNFEPIGIKQSLRLKKILRIYESIYLRLTNGINYELEKIH